MSNKTEENLENVESALYRSEKFIEKNQKMLTIFIAAMVVVVGGYLSYQKFYKAPLENEAQAQMFVAERYFERDSFNLALNGDVNYPGFIGVIEDYSSTSTANLANYYAGVCYYRLNDFDNAIVHLQNFKSSDIMLNPIAKGLLGDAYSEKNDLNKAVSYYMEAAEANSNDFTTPMFLVVFPDRLRGTTCRGHREGVGTTPLHCTAHCRGRRRAMGSTCALLADRHPNLLSAVRGLLEQQFDNVVMVSDERSLFAAVERLRPDVLVIDLSLHGPGRTSEVPRLRGRFPDLNIVVLSIHDESSVAEKTIADGANGFVLKRSAAVELIPAIERVMDGQTYVSEWVER